MKLYKHIFENMPNPLPLISYEVDAPFRFEFECENELVFCLDVSASILS